MKQVTVTFTFDSLEDLTAYLVANPAAATAKVADTQPSAEVTPITAAAPTPAPAPVPTPAPAAAPAPAPAPAAQPEEDAQAHRERLGGVLRKLADGMEDPSPVAKFINGFGVARFSDLPDEELATFEASLTNEFGAQLS